MGPGFIKVDQGYLAPFRKFMVLWFSKLTSFLCPRLHRVIPLKYSRATPTSEPSYSDSMWPEWQSNLQLAVAQNVGHPQSQYQMPAICYVSASYVLCTFTKAAYLYV